MARSSKLESGFQDKLFDDLRELFPNSFVEKWSPYQGYPDVLILYKDMWATLECKKSNKETYEPNQEYYIDILNQMSFSRMICPQNKEEVLDDLVIFFNRR